MNPITSALVAGYTGLQILDYIIKQFPQMKGRVEQALQSGYTPEQITSHFEKQFAGQAPTKKKKQLSEQIGQKPLTDAEKSHARDLRSNREQKVGKILGTTALMAGGAAAGGAALRALGARGASTQAATQLPFYGQGPGATGMPLPGAQPTPGPQPMGGGSPMQGAMPGGPNWTNILKAYQQHLAKGGKLSLNSFVKTAFKTMAGDMMGQMAGGRVPQAAQPQGMQEPIDVTDEVEVMGQQQPMPQPNLQAETAMPQQSTAPMAPSPQVQQPLPQEMQQAISPEEAAATLENMKLVTKVDNLIQAGNDSEVIKAMINFQLSPGQKKWLADQKLDINQVLDGYLSKPPETSETLAKKQQSQPKVETPQEEPSQVPSIGKTAMLPNGTIGQVTDVDDKVTRLEADGKKLKAPNDQVWVPSEDVRLYADTEIDDWISRIPEKERSTAFYTYQKLPNDMVMVEVTSDPTHVYIYQNVPEELSDKILSASTNPKTSGDNLFGIYRKEVADSRGSPFAELRMNPDKYPFIKVKKGYDIFQRIKQESTGKMKRDKKEEARKRREEKRTNKR